MGLEQIACESTTMRTLVVFAVLLAVAYEQFECDGCDSFPDRKSRTGCRLFCYFDFDNAGVLTRGGLIRRLRNDQDTAQGMSRQRFLELGRDRLGYCSDEAGAAFDLIAELAGSNPEFIDEADINTLADLFEALSGTDRLAKEVYVELYDLVYLAIGNDSCNIGY